METLYYLCKKCNNTWEDDYDSQYGYCDSECDKCGKDFSPFNNYNEYKKELRKLLSEDKEIKNKITSLLMKKLLSEKSIIVSSLLVDLNEISPLIDEKSLIKLMDDFRRSPSIVKKCNEEELVEIINRHLF